MQPGPFDLHLHLRVWRSSACVKIDDDDDDDDDGRSLCVWSSSTCEKIDEDQDDDEDEDDGKRMCDLRWPFR